ncbi:DUF2225 domain-containing protein [Bacillus sp. FJAT-45037]|uniref:DUF2225 domain-containing protein n=1 Tax=Bacillus sp. FJAT-45037 TaxID=2011007 RepID=UPI000C24ECA8|nr:DUF2225 domain-containing protein [Bacillus sp. FJAT-45037]
MSEITPHYDKECTCMLCENRYTTKKLRTRFIKVEKIHSDYYTEYKDLDINPSYYEVAVCPHCGFASSEMFSPHFPAGTLDAIREKLGQWKSQDFGGERTRTDAIRTMKLGLISASLKKEKHVVVAGLCLRLAWLYRGLEIKEEQEEQRFLFQALKSYKASYEEGDYLGTQMSDMRILYLIAELSRQLGYAADAVRCFSEVIQHKNRATEPKLVEMAREQWYILRQDIKEVGNI